MTERDFAIDVVRRLRESGYEALWAGGCVRDELLGLAPDDFDVATSARPEQVVALFRRTVEVGAAFGVVEVIGPRRDDHSHPIVQVATFRSDGAYVDGRRPESVVFSSAAEDAQRRDFTINGMFFDPLAGQVIDYVGGKADLERGVLRAIGDPHARFREDKLRLLRAIRMAARFGFPIEAQTAEAIRAMAPQITVVSAERIAEELRKILVHPNRGLALALIEEVGLQSPLFPGLAGIADWDRIIRVAERLRGPRWPGPRPVSFPLAFALVTAALGATAVATRARQLKLANDEIARIQWLVANRSALRNPSTMRPSQRHPLLIHPGIGELLALHRAEAEADGASVEGIDFCERLLETTPAEVLDPPPLLTGDDLVALSWKPGPDFKRILDEVRAGQLDGLLHSRDEAITLARSLYSSKSSS